jgi:hypothetical protein
MQQFGRYLVRSGHDAAVANWSFVTLSDISPPSIDALRRTHSPLCRARHASLVFWRGTAATCPELEHEPTCRGHRGCAAFDP